MKTTTQKAVIENMKLLGFKNVSRKEFANSEDNLDVIEIHCFKLKPSSVSWRLYFKKMFKLNKMEAKQ